MVSVEDGRGEGGTRPSGTMTFLLSDVEGSTRLWAVDAAAMSASLQVHDEIVRGAIESAGGYVFSTAGDSFAAAFARASDAVSAATGLQERLGTAQWRGPRLRVRIGLHLGEAEERGGDYFGPAVNTAARVQAAGHGGQTLLTELVRAAARVDEVLDLGVHHLRDVGEPLRLLQLGKDDFPPLRVIDPASTNLPVAPTSLVGRAEDLRRVREVLATQRLVTLTAGGGTGKTRLALAVGEQELLHRPDGVWFVDLTAVTDGAQVPAAVAAGLGLQLLSGDAIGQILEFLADKDLLLILDNCEHLIDECAAFAERFVARPGGAVMLATSRERLDVDGEHTLVVPPLGIDEDDEAALELFVQRALAVQPSFSLHEGNRGVLRELCRRLDGVPLAIELAAARSTVLSPQELLAGIEDRFQLLHGGRRRQRQRTLEATLDWSYNLLDAEEQRTLRALGTFVGTFDLVAVAALLDVPPADAVDLIDSLIAKSLVIREEAGGRSRFRLFETTAAYAQQQLVVAGEAATVRDCHLAHYLALAQRHPAAMWGDLHARQTLGQDKANVVSGFEWAAAQGRWSDAARLLLGAFTVFYDAPSEGVDLAERCQANLPPDGRDDVVVRLFSNLWRLHTALWDGEATREDVRALRTSPAPLHQVHGWAHVGNGVGLFEPGKGLELLQRGIEIQRTLAPGLDATQAAALCEIVAGFSTLYLGDAERALLHARAAIDLEAEVGLFSEFSAHGFMVATVSLLLLGDPAAAFDVVEQYRRSPRLWGSGDDLEALVHLELGDLVAARASAVAYVRQAATGRVLYQATDSLLVLAALFEAENQPDAARELLLGMGIMQQGALIAYGRHLARRLGIGAEYEANEVALRSDPTGKLIKQRAAEDLEALRRELARRGW